LEGFEVDVFTHTIRSNQAFPVPRTTILPLHRLLIDRR
jgi:hypothetical protein